MKASSIRRWHGFTLVELLLAVSILAILVTLLADAMVLTQNTMTRATGHVTEFQEARSGLDAISNTVADAVMDGYWAYKMTGGSPTSYERTSDHHFILGNGTDLIGASAEAGQAVFFQAPMGFAGTFTETGSAKGTASLGLEQLHHLVNCWGFYVSYGDDLTERPGFLQTGDPLLTNPTRPRFRLMQYAQPAEESVLYQHAFGLNAKTSKSQALNWYKADLAAKSRPVAENILALILVPSSVNVITADAAKGYTNAIIEPDPAYSYDSRAFQWGSTDPVSISRRHQLPPTVQITMIATNEKSYDKFVQQSGGDQKAAEAVRKIMTGRFASYDKFQGDLTAVEAGLDAIKLHHRTLTTTVTLRSSKWITEP